MEKKTKKHIVGYFYFQANTFYFGEGKQLLMHMPKKIHGNESLISLALHSPKKNMVQPTANCDETLLSKGKNCDSMFYIRLIFIIPLR
jgi:hypothetical protein